jgi:hypothetical protein
MRSRVLVPLVLAIALAMAACTSTEVKQSAPAPWEGKGASWMQGAGTPLAKDLVVPQDAFLVGPVFTLAKLYGKHREGHKVLGQEGLLYGTSSATLPGVAQSLYQQGGTATRLIEGSSLGLCTQRGPESETEFTGDLVNGSLGVECRAFDRGNSGFEFDLSLEPPTADGTVTGQVRWGPSMALPSSTLPDVPNVEGGPSEVANNVEGYDDLTIVEGSFLAGPPGPGTGTGGYRAVIGVTGDPDEVFDAYIAQGGTQGKGTHSDLTVGDLHIRTFQSGGAGGILYTVTLNEQHGNAWIYVTALND